MVCVESEISRKKQTRPMIRQTIAKINKGATKCEGSRLRSYPINKATITVATNKAETVHRVIDQCTHTARFDNKRISCRFLGEWESRSINTRYRSTTRPSLTARTDKIAPMPVSKKTGATASWITWDTVLKSSTIFCILGFKLT